ncbi:Retrovirus-related Pol Polyprotein from transposon 412, partial [Phytophthora megakarya]
GLGATLTQDQGQGEQSIAYASKVNSDTVVNYRITDLECAAVIWAVKLFRPYLYGRQFELVTNHAALKWLMTSKDLTGRLHRWALQLQEYNFEVVYRPGATNVVADALSRAPVNVVAGVPRVVGGHSSDEQQGPAQQAAAGGEGQLTDEEIRVEQTKDRTVRKLRAKGKYGAWAVVEQVDRNVRVVLPTVLRAKALRACHDSVFACHLRTPQTYARVAANYWWPDMRTHVRQWVQPCRDCGLRKAKPKEVIPPLRSQGVGDAGDRWAIDVAGPLPMTANGNRGGCIVGKLVMVFGPARELVMDGALELNGEVIGVLVDLLQARQVTPVPYRPALLGLVERFHRSWKDMVAIFVSEAQDDWDHWLPCTAYAYNGAKQTTSGVSQIGVFAEYHRKLVTRMESANAAAKQALTMDQRRRAKYYNRKEIHTTEFTVGDSVWVLKPPRGRGFTKLAHQWVGPATIVQSTGFDNWEVTRDDTGEHLVVHCSFLVSSRCPNELLGVVADNILAELREESDEATDDGGAMTGARDQPVLRMSAVGNAVEVSTGGEHRGGERDTTETRDDAGAESRGGSTEQAPGTASDSASPGIVVGVATNTGRAETRVDPVHALAEPNLPRRRRQRRNDDDGDDARRKQQRREEADAARSARTVRRQATRDRPVATTEAMAANADSGVHGGATTGVGDDGDRRDEEGNDDEESVRQPGRDQARAEREGGNGVGPAGQSATAARGTDDGGATGEEASETRAVAEMLRGR